MTTRDDIPVWLLDVDGTLNAIAWAAPDNYIECFATDEHGDTYPIRYNPDVVNRIAGLHEREKVKVMWLTDWGVKANHDIRKQLDLPFFEVLEDPPNDTKEQPWWKLGAVQRFAANTEASRIIWTDDDLALEPDARQWAGGKNMLCISPRMHVGLTTTDVDTIEKYLAIDRLLP